MPGLVELSLQDALALAESIVDTIRDPLLVLDGELRVVSASRSFYQMFGVSREDTEGRLIYELGNHQLDIPGLRILLEEILPNNTTFGDFEVEHHFEHIGRKIMLLNARRLRRGSGEREMILLAIEDATERRDAEKARQEAETRFTEMVKNVRDHSIFLTDPDGVVTSWNVAAERIIGYPEAEAVGQHFSLIFTPEDIQAGLPEQELRQAREWGRAEDERWHRRKGGEQFWALGIVTPLRDATGKLTGYSKVLRDMTERKRVEDALRLTEERFHHAMNIGTVGVLFFSLGGRVADANAAFERMSGYTVEELRALTDCSILTPPEFRDVTDRAVGKLVQRGETAPYEKQMVRKDGSRFWALCAPTRLSGSGRDSECVEFIIDITRAKQAEAALRESEERFRLMVQSVQDYAIFLMDPDGNVASWNEGAERILGYAADEIVGKPAALFFTEKDRRSGLPERELKTAAEMGKAVDENWLVSKQGGGSGPAASRPRCATRPGGCVASRRSSAT